MIAATPPPVAIGVGLREWRVTTYRAAVPTGPVRFRLTNFGEDAHDLQVRDPRGRVLGRSPEVPAFGGRGTLALTLRRPGTHRLVCALPGHAKAGMRATLRVRARSAGGA